MLGRAVRSAVASVVRRWEIRRIVEHARRVKALDGAQAAARVLSRGLESHPHDARLWNDLSALQIQQQQFAEAEYSARCALELRPDLAEAHSNLGIVRAQRGEEDSALGSFRRALQLDPALTAARENQAALLSRLQRVDDAIAAWDELLRIDPSHAMAYAGKGALLLRAGWIGEARDQLERAKALGLHAPHVTLHLALVEAAAGDAAAAERIIESLRGQSEDAEIDWNLALIRLSRGDFAAGWPLYEARLRKSFESPRRAYPFPEWSGESLASGELLVMAEQGLGDEIMFASCYPDLLERAPRCVIECDPRLAGLFARSFPGASVFGAPRDNDGRWLNGYPEVRRQIHAGSLPRLFRTGADRFPRRAGYLRPDDRRVEAWRGRLSALGETLKAGISWSGGLPHTRRELRRVPLAELAPLLRDPRYLFVSLQYDDDGSGAAQLSALSGAIVHVFPEALGNPDEMAALMRALDLVITVCSSAAHLGGSIGAPTWVVAPSVPEWRYLRTGETLPWYPSVRLFRQQRNGEWSPVIANVAAALHARAAQRRRTGQAGSGQ